MTQDGASSSGKGQKMWWGDKALVAGDNKPRSALGTVALFPKTVHAVPGPGAGASRGNGAITQPITSPPAPTLHVFRK